MVSFLIGGAVTVAALSAIMLAGQDANYRIERSVKINASKTSIFAVLRDFRQFEHWSPWEKLDPKMQKTFEGETAAVGSYYHWSGNKEAGEGTMTVVEVQPNEGIDLRVEFFRPFPSQTLVRWSVADTGDGSQIVTWSMKGKHANFMAKVFGIMMKSILNKNFDEGLARLKAFCEKA